MRPVPSLHPLGASARPWRPIAFGVLALSALAACERAPTAADASLSDTLLADAFSSVPAGYATPENTFAAAESDEWRPMRRRPPGRGGPFGAAFGLGFMGGGLGGDFLHGDGFRAGVARGPFNGAVAPGTCSAPAGGARLTCPPGGTRPGLTVERSVVWTDVNGAVQRAPDSTTHSMETRVTVFGTLPSRDGITRTVRHESERLITGLEQGSAERTVNGTSAGRETVTGEREAGTFSAERVVADTTRNLVIPVRESGRSYPIAGTVIRTMTVTATVAGEPRETASWREQLTYDGSATATLVITRNGETKTCTVALPGGRPVCP